MPCLHLPEPARMGKLSGEAPQALPVEEALSPNNCSSLMGRRAFPASSYPLDNYNRSWPARKGKPIVPLRGKVLS